MNNDIQKYPIYELYKGKLHKIEWLKSTSDYNHFMYQLHHFVERKLLKKYPELEKHQKLILMPKDCNYDIDRRIRNFEKRWGIKLEEVVYLRC
jgi:hypothetical protein